MKFKKIISVVISIMIMTSLITGIGITANAEDNPYNYSSEPTRAIYYVLPTMKGNDVKWVQCALNLYGNYGLDIDGSFGPACKEATKKFQASMGLEQDGSFGPTTRQTMVNWLNTRNQSSVSQEQPQQSQTEVSQPQQTLSDNPYNYSSEPTRAIYYVIPTMRGNDVKWVQSALNAYGNYGLDIDGSFGPACRKATKQFQASEGLSQDGSFGPTTRARMVSWLSSHGATNENTNKSSSQYNLCWPVSSSASGAKLITSSLGNRTAPVAGASVNHKGIDIGVPSGTNVYATYGGIVTGVGYTSKRGNYIVIYHGEIGLTSIYQHLSSINVSQNQSINFGDLIGTSGSTGNVTGPHLHFELVKTATQAQSYVDCAWKSDSQLIDGHYDNEMINYTFKN